MWAPSTSASVRMHDLVVAALVDVELVAEAGADGRDERLDLVVLEHLVDAGPLDVEDLAPDGQDRLRRRVAGLHGGAAGGVALDDEQLALLAVLRRAVLELVGHAGAVEQRLVRTTSRAFLAAARAWAAAMPLRTILLASVGFSSSQSPSFSLVARCTSVFMVVLPSLALVWPSNCGSRSRTEMMAGDALADVLAREVGVLLLEQALGPGVLVDRGGERRLEALDVGAALDRVDAVGEAVDAVGVVARVPLERDLDLGVSSAVGEVADLREQALLRLVDVLDEVDDAARVLVDDRLGVVVRAARR